MQCFIYKGNRKQDTYLYITREADFSQVPQSLRDLLGELTSVMEITLTENKMLANADAKTVIKQLDEQGYYLQMPPAVHEIQSLKAS